MGTTRVLSNSPSSVETACSGLSSVVGQSHLRPAPPADSIDGVVPENIAEPASASELASVLKIARDAGWCVIPRGSGTKLGWGNPPKAAHLILSTRRLNQLIEHAWGDMTAIVEAGCVFADFQNALAEHGQRLVVDPLWPDQATIGGILASNDSGTLRTRFGSLRDLIIGISLALPDGTLAKSGGKVVKNVAGYDIAKLATGSLGTLGVIVQAIFRLHPVPAHTRSLSFSIRDSQAMTPAMLAIMDSQLTPAVVQIRAESASPPTIDVLLEGTAAGCDAQCGQIARLLAPLGSPSETDVSVWNARERLFAKATNAAVCKVSFLSAEFGIFSDYLTQQSQSLQFSWTLVAQAVGIGLLRLETGSIATLREVIVDLRKQLESRAGSLVILECPREIKSGIDVWGSPGDTLPLMKSIKAQFDPAGVLNPGRFVGSI